ncbi:hypothetical protein D9758_010289 [Tetrapyrgos nigripes]|uniref:Uncharacterized protein n=1 Tax=Tetrapyrgos nigripes TaxID=182062 RepID=A0A8H5GAF8_9AGAR|nr:hypothetical protein D9758_010289 [Tetrapyrgos nigripes]
MFPTILFFASWTLLSLAAVPVSAIPLNTTDVIPRAFPSGPVTCGSHVYSVSIVKAATSNGFAHLDNPIGSNSYPHAFENFEGLRLFCTGETQFSEWPILPAGPYTGGDPGADRVIFSDNGVYCADDTDDKRSSPLPRLTLSLDSDSRLLPTR